MRWKLLCWSLLGSAIYVVKKTLIFELVGLLCWSPKKLINAPCCESSRHGAARQDDFHASQQLVATAFKSQSTNMLDSIEYVSSGCALQQQILIDSTGGDVRG